MFKKQNNPKIFRSAFLRDVLICSLGAYGGPEAHMGVFMDQMVARRRYLSEEDLVELIALCSILPGPTSTQTIVAIGYKAGGPMLALLTMLVWAAPVLLAMTALSFMYAIFSAFHISFDILNFIGSMAVGFIIVAAWRIGMKVVTDRLTLLLMVFGAVSTYLVRSPWIFPLVLVAGGISSILGSGEKEIWNRARISPPWRYLFLFVFFAVSSLCLSLLTDIRLISIFESFYRYGYLVFGGGQVVVPVMHSELVELNRYMTNAEFLTGYGLVQGLPGPLFSFAAYAGGMAFREGSVIKQVSGALAGGVGIFLPGLLLIYFIYPVWEDIKKIRAVKISLKGINAVAGGMIAIAAIILMQASGFGPANLLMTGITVIILATKKIPAPLIVVLSLVAGIVL
ncbi:MAG: chromate efflux transporter [Bacteroidales bacterium]|nr:chromate efflux transporter [Bacteroidales bacterium]